MRSRATEQEKKALNSSLFSLSFPLSWGKKKKKKKQSNVPALNDLLAPFGIAFGDAVLEGPVGGVFVGEDPPAAGASTKDGGKSYDYASGANIARFPAGGTLFEARLAQRASEGVAATPVDGGKDTQEATDGEGGLIGRHAILGLARSGSGAVAAYGDSGCLDSSHQQGDCFWLLDRILDFAIRDVRDSALFGSVEEAESESLKSAFALQKGGDGGAGGDCPLPSRPLDLPAEEALPFSSVKDRNAHPPACEPNSALQFAGTHWPPLAKEEKAKREAEKPEVVAGAGASAAASSGGSSSADAKPSSSRKDLPPPKDASDAAAALFQKDANSGSSDVDASDVPQTAAATNSSGRNGKSHHSSSSSSSTRPRSPPTSTSSSSSSSTSYPTASYYSSAALNAKNLVRSAGSRAAAARGSHFSSPVALTGVGAAAALLAWAFVGAKRRRRAVAAAVSAGTGAGADKQRYSRVGGGGAVAPISPSSLADYGVELGNALRRPGALTSSNSRSAAHLKE